MNDFTKNVNLRTFLNFLCAVCLNLEAFFNFCQKRNHFVRKNDYNHKWKMSVLVSATDFKSAERVAGYLLGSSILSSSRQIFSLYSYKPLAHHLLLLIYQAIFLCLKSALR